MGLRLARRGLVLTALFSSYMFVYMVTLTFIDLGSAGIFSPSRQLALHYIDLFLTAAGFFAFAPLARCRFRRRLPAVLGAVYGCGMAVLGLLKAALPFSLAAMACALSLGILGGMVYFAMSQAMSQGAGAGKAMALGASAAVALQYLLQGLLSWRLVTAALLAAAFAAALFLAARQPRRAADAPAAPEQVTGRSLMLLALTVVALSVIGTFYDTQMMRLNVETSYQTYNYYAWPRLSIIVSYLLLGFLGDLHRQRYVPLAAFCVAIFAVFNPILFGEVEDYHLNMCLYYTCLGANIAYFNLMFWHIAPKTRHPALWAGMGRGISGLAEAALAAAHVGDLPLHWIIGLDLLMFVVLVIALAAGGYLLLGAKTAPGAELPPEERLRRYAQRCALTPRETEVLELLLTTDDDLKTIAESLYISRRMVQRYVSSIYEKTDTKTRLGLFQQYLHFTAD